MAHDRADRLVILFVGDYESPQFGEARADLHQRGRLWEFADLPGALAAIPENGPPPDLVVLAQAIPGRFDQRELQRFRHILPLARWVVLLGSLCEGESRTGDPIAGAIRIYWHQWPALAQRRLFGPTSQKWGSISRLPKSAGEDEFVLAETEAFPLRKGLVGIVSAAAMSFGMLKSACRSTGWATVHIQPRNQVDIDGLDAILFDGTDGLGDELDLLCEVAECHPCVPIVAVLGFPRPEDVRRLGELGVRRIVSRPFGLADLVGQIEDVIERP